MFDCLHYNGETLLDKFVFETVVLSAVSVFRVAILRSDIERFE